jgi:putative ABC transport system permease protein
LILALSIGANAVIFRTVDAALLRPLPFPESDRLVRVWSTKNGMPIGNAGGPSVLDMRDFAANAHSFEGLIVYDDWRKNVSGILGSNQAEETIVGLVSRTYFELLRIRPILGRLFSEAENVYGGHHVAIISRQFWKTRFGGDPGVLGKTVRINGETYSIIGVVPDVIPGWMDQTAAPIHIWTPFASEEARSMKSSCTTCTRKPLLAAPHSMA